MFQKEKQNSTPGLNHYSDQGGLYAYRQYVEEPEKHNVIMGMSSKGNPYDNAYNESLLKTPKN